MWNFVVYIVTTRYYWVQEALIGLKMIFFAKNNMEEMQKAVVA